MRYDELVADYEKHLEAAGKSASTIYGYTRDLQRYQNYHVENYNVEWFAEETSKSDVTTFLQHLYDQSRLKPSTRNRILHALRSFFEFCCTRGLLQSDPTAYVKSARSPRQEAVYVAEQEYGTLRDAITNPAVRTGVITQWYTGLRGSELLKLSIRDVDLDSGWIHVLGTHDRDRRIPIHPTLHLAIVNYLDIRPGAREPFQRLLATEQSGALSLSHYNRELQKAVTQSGWSKNISSHSLRHSFATNLAARNVPLHVIQHLLGHKAPNVTFQYIHSNDEQLIRAINLL